MPAKTFDDFQKRVDQWTQDMLNDDDKMKAWVDKHKSLDDYNKSPEWEKRYSLPSAKENALDELFGVK